MGFTNPIEQKFLAKYLTCLEDNGKVFLAVEPRDKDTRILLGIQQSKPLLTEDTSPQSLNFCKGTLLPRAINSIAQDISNPKKLLGTFENSVIELDDIYRNRILDNIYEYSTGEPIEGIIKGPDGKEFTLSAASNIALELTDFGGLAVYQERDDAFEHLDTIVLEDAKQPLFNNSRSPLNP